MENVILFGMINKMARTGAPRRHTQAEYLKEVSVNSGTIIRFSLIYVTLCKAVA